MGLIAFIKDKLSSSEDPERRYQELQRRESTGMLNSKLRDELAHLRVHILPHRK